MHHILESALQERRRHNSARHGRLVPGKLLAQRLDQFV